MIGHPGGTGPQRQELETGAIAGMMMDGSRRPSFAPSMRYICARCGVGAPTPDGLCEPRAITWEEP